MTAIRTDSPTMRPAAGTQVRRSATFVFLALSGTLGLLLTLLAAPASAHPPGVTERVSVGSTGAAGDGDSSLASISGDGRYVAFWSFASNLVPGDANGTSDVFVRDRVAGTIERVSVDSRERQATGGDQGGVLDTNFGRPVITPDGRFVAFASSATNLVKGDRNNTVDIFLRDQVAGTTERVTMAGRKTEANSESSVPAISPDARFIAFRSFADNLVPGDTNFTADVFLLDRQARTVVRASVTSAGQQADNASGSPAITPDGRFVVFESSALLLPGETEDFASDVYLRDLQAGTTEGISTATTGFVRHSVAPTISADGRFVAFQSWDGGLVPGDTNDRYDIFVFDRTTGSYERVSVDSVGGQADDDSLGPAMTPDGRFVAFTSLAGNLVPGDGNFDADVFVHDRVTHTTVRASVRTDGTETGFELGSANPSLSTDGQVVAFESEGALVPQDTGFPVDVFVHDEQP
jgi:Tol biopolymer transport system component